MAAKLTKKATGHSFDGQVPVVNTSIRVLSLRLDGLTLFWIYFRISGAIFLAVWHTHQLRGVYDDFVNLKIRSPIYQYRDKVCSVCSFIG